MSAVEDLDDVKHDTTSDPIRMARMAVRALLTLARSDWATSGLPEAQDLRKRRTDSAVLLSITEVALEPDTNRATHGLKSMLDQLDDERWLEDLATIAATQTSLGVLSLGESTLSLLDRTLDNGRNHPELRTDSRAIRRGLLQFATPISLISAHTANCLLVPVVARQANRIWTTSKCRKAVRAAAEADTFVLPVAHPLMHLSPLSRQAFRPASTISDIQIPG